MDLTSLESTMIIFVYNLLPIVMGIKSTQKTPKLLCFGLSNHKIL